MKRQYILLVLLALTYISSADAQNRNRLVFNDETAIKYFSGGFTKDSVLTLYAKEGYDALSVDEKRQTMECFMEKFTNYQVNVQVNENKKELWMAKGGSLCLIDTWEMKEKQPGKTAPVATEPPRRASRIFYYVGGLFSGSKGSHNGTITGRMGIFLAKDRWDASLTLDIGYVKNDKFQFAGSTGLDTRVYFPIRKIHLAPYVGSGISWTYSPTMYFELKIMTGTCWFVGVGSIDVGAHYGLKSGFSFSAGYTFQPRLKSK